ncbi:SRPBCC domain-containing protein [Novosphingobium sp. G106]|uniref:SRPBCC domain-containing protein n=1 Tax=Novosphingobium sp. G106 TaxID=2849500 RepID=UPI001C2CECE9|nr:SRPBCC domain-containing protein [Novosphingobium sp. G106]MBV1686435.1 SRPBCC domain-containing protein [Novosphingobium sp. G106]
MDRSSEEGEVVQAARVVLASPRALFRAFLDPETMAGWRAFDGVDLAFSALNARIGGGYRIRIRSLTGALGPALPGTLDLAVEFVELVGEERIVEAIRVVTDDPNLAGSMTLTTTFEPDRDGTKVTFQARGGPAFVDADKQAEILAASLRKLALLTE